MALYVDDVKKSVQEVFELLGVKGKIPEKTAKNKSFQLTRIDVDRENGGNRIKKSINGVPKFVIYLESSGQFVTVRFANQQIPQKDAEPKYSPLNLSLFPDEEGNMAVEVYEEFVFWFLHPKHDLSPFHKAGTPSDYRYFDKDKIAKESLEKDEFLVNSISILIGDNAWNIFKLRQFAKGIRMVGVDDLSDYELKAELKKLAYQDPVGFYNKTLSNTARFDGLLQDAIDKGILKLESKNGLQRWYLKNEEILPIHTGMNATEAIFDHIANNFNELIPLIKDELAGTNRESKLKNIENAANVLEIDTPEQLNLHQKEAQSKELTAIEKSIAKVNEDESFRKKIAENLALEEKEGDKLHHAKKQWLIDNREAIEHYKEKYANVK